MTERLESGDRLNAGVIAQVPHFEHLERERVKRGKRTKKNTHILCLLKECTIEGFCRILSPEI